jgi:hypothetical protein
MAGFTVSSLGDYVRENANQIYTDAALGAQTLKDLGISIQAGVKKTDALMIFQNTAPFQADSSCGFNASGSSTFSDRDLTVVELKWQDQWCPKDLAAKFTSTKLAAGAQRQQEVLPFEQVIMQEVMNNINTQLEYAIWQGDSTNPFVNYMKHFSGFVKTIDGASPIAATATADVTTSNVISILNNIYDNIPAALLNNPERPMEVFTGYNNFKLLVQALFTLNNYHFDVANAWKTLSLEMPGTGLKVKAVKGLTDLAGATYYGKDVMGCTYAKNLFYGTDLEGDYEDAKVWYSQDDDVIKGSIRWKSGVQVARPGEIILYKNS